ncbi:CP family cyanate transporter-like MFS transporter [Cellulosimicrobium cellulans]|uniref:CynX/NimT family MFS transporter n=1 Tax=Cellulosimicrobium cellulans TaxID=1710 RepID=UPI00195EDAB7|nr:MFS transporter [Cellulosimicrobium cellulans]MBM7819105.1 CP family cyanate transporter-like MFS transporter [Cellulosimicrobium cellulans]
MSGLRRPLGVGAVVAIVLASLNLRPAVVAISPLLGEIRADLGLSATAAGVLTTLPVLCFGLLAPLAPVLARRWGLERALFVSLVVLCVGFALRLVPETWGLFAGTVVAGCAIGLGNVLLPALIKRDFADRIGLMTGLYSMALSGGAALAAGLTLPVATAAGLDWRGALATWGVLAVLGVLVWVPRALRPDPAGSTAFGAGAGAGVARSAVWRSPLAWAVTVVMGMQSLSFYAVNAWLPEIMVALGRTPEAGGWLLALCNLAGILGSFVTPILAGRMRRQRGVGVVLVVLVGTGLLGLALAPGAAALWVVLVGLGQGGGISLALTLMALRARDAAHTSELSGMAQSAGYLLAATGPLGLGLAHDATGAWTLPLFLLVAAATVQGVAVWFAGRDAHVH